MHPRSVVFPVLVAVLVGAGLSLTPLRAAAQQPTSVPPPAQVLTAAEAQRVFTDVLQRYFEAYARQDLNGMVAEWHPAGPARFTAQHRRRRVRPAAGCARRAGRSAAPRPTPAAAARGRSSIWPSPTRRAGGPRASGGSATSRCCRTTSGAWKIWNEGTVNAELARRLLAIPEADRESALASDPELASSDTLAGLAAEAGTAAGSRPIRRCARGTRASRRAWPGSSVTRTVVGRSLLQTGSLQMLTGRHAEALEAFTAARDAFVAEGNLARHRRVRRQHREPRLRLGQVSRSRRQLPERLRCVRAPERRCRDGQLAARAGQRALHADRVRPGARVLQQGARRSSSGRRTATGSRACFRPSRW